jgi:serine protease AprX
MKNRILLLLLVILSLSVPFPGIAGLARMKIWIFFKDRPFLNGPAAPVKLTPAAIQRRKIRGEISVDESDFPVETRYIDAVKKAGATVLVTSRWLNAVSALCDRRCQENLGALGFVSEVRPVITYKRKNEWIRPATDSDWEASKKLKYGESLDQLQQIQVPGAHIRGFAGQGEIVAIFDGGFRKDHIAFKNKTIVAEHDFVFNDDNVTEGGNTDSHGTSTWSCVGGEVPGKLYGPAYKASFILAVTEDIRSETKVEEDNWVAAFEWADQLGVTVISSSLGYRDWYTSFDFDGNTAVTSKVASRAAKKGILVVNSAGNEGPLSSTLNAPADAKKILTVGAVDVNGLIANFSSRGPTADGRTKPEVVARGVDTFVAASFKRDGFGRSNGTSFSCPLTAGAAATLLSAHPEWKPVQVIEAFTATASQSSSPDNTYGWGIVNLTAALDYLPKKSVVIDQHKPLKNTTNNSSPYRVEARIRAQRGLNTSQLFLLWKPQGTSAFHQVPLTPVAGKTDYFQGFIPAQPPNSTVLYYLSARDAKGKAGKLPATAPASPFSFQVR